MPRFTIRAIGKLPTGWPREAAADFLERLSPFAQLQVIELPEGHEGSLKPDIERTRRIEAASLLKNLPEEALVIALDETGKQYSSPDFATFLSQRLPPGGTVIFLIGGSWGLDVSVRERADLIWSLGKITLPHALARIVLLEQVYRTILIQSGKTYHK